VQTQDLKWFLQVYYGVLESNGQVKSDRFGEDDKQECGNFAEV